VDITPRKKGGVLVNTSPANPVLQIHSVSASYGEVEALKGISLDVNAGEILGVVGPNGAGKSTLIKVLSGVLAIKSGQVLINKQEISSYSPAERARTLAVVPQARHVGGAFTVKQAVLLGRNPYLGFLGNPGKIDLERVSWAMNQTGVADLAERKLAEISGGEQQRVLLARALAQDTPVLLLDEPTNHLDLKFQVNLLRLLKTLVSRENLTVLMAMHDLNQVSGIADNVALLKEGKLYKLGKPREVLTSEHIKETYQTEVETFTHPNSKQHLIFPIR
jgi:iron complex transport system ATP-binding protein